MPFDIECSQPSPAPEESKCNHNNIQINTALDGELFECFDCGKGWKSIQDIRDEARQQGAKAERERILNLYFSDPESFLEEVNKFGKENLRKEKGD